MAVTSQQSSLLVLVYMLCRDLYGLCLGVYPDQGAKGEPSSRFCHGPHCSRCSSAEGTLAAWLGIYSAVASGLL